MIAKGNILNNQRITVAEQWEHGEPSQDVWEQHVKKELRKSPCNAASGSTPEKSVTNFRNYAEAYGYSTETSTLQTQTRGDSSNLLSLTILQERSKSPSHPINPELYAEEKRLLVHSNTPNTSHGIPCPDCKKTFADNRTMQRHSVIHRGLRPFSCQDCGKAFMLRGDLTRHILIHSGKRPFSCNICERRFTLKGNLMQHIRTHTPEKQFTCTLCRKSFSQKESLYRHIRAHFGEKPYSCDACGKCFSLRGDLTRHSLIHTGQRPHICPICSRSFALKGNMMQHMRTHSNSNDSISSIEATYDKASPPGFNFEQVPQECMEKQIASANNTNSSNNQPFGKEPLIEINFSSENNLNLNNASRPVSPIPRHVCASVPNGSATNCLSCMKAFSSREAVSNQVTYLDPSSSCVTQEHNSKQVWPQSKKDSGMCPLGEKPTECHKLSLSEFTCTLCRRSFQSKSEHFHHSCSKGVETEERSSTSNRETGSREAVSNQVTYLDPSNSCVTHEPNSKQVWPQLKKDSGMYPLREKPTECHKLLRAELTCTLCRRSFQSKSEHFHHSCSKGVEMEERSSTGNRETGSCRNNSRAEQNGTIKSEMEGHISPAVKHEPRNIAWAF